MDNDTNPLTVMSAKSLQDYKIKGLPSSAFYIADFISKEEEEFLLAKIAAAPKPRWKNLSKRRLQTWPSDLTKNTLLDSPLPSWLVEPIISRILSLPRSAANTNSHIFDDSPHGAPNHVLINEYFPGQGIMAHKDGSAYHPVVCTVSLGSGLCLDLYGSKEDGAIEQEPRWKIFQESRSLLITTDQLYTDYLHGIEETKEEVDLNATTIVNWDLLKSTDGLANGRFNRELRTSLTYRDVIKVSKLGSKLTLFGQR